MKKNMIMLLLVSIALLNQNCSKDSSASFNEMSLTDIALDKSVTKMQSPVEQPKEYSQKLRKTGYLAFKTSDLNKTSALIYNTVAELKGFISNENTSQYNNRIEIKLSIRVPSDKFDELIQKISTNASVIDHKSIEVEDVTQEYIDIDKRLKTKKELETRYIQLLQKATKVDEILKIEEQIGKLREEIESTEGQFRYLNNQITLSTIEVNFYTQSSNEGFWKKLGQGFSNGWDNVLSIFVGLANLWAIILMLVVVVFLIKRWIKMRKAKKALKN